MIQPPVAKQQRLSITAKLIIILLAIALSPMVLTTALNFQNSVQAITLSEQANLRLIANGLADRLDQLIGGVQRVTRLVANDPIVVDFLVDALDEKKEGVARLLQRIRDHSTDIEHVYVMDQHGVFIASTNTKVIGDNYNYREYFQAAAQGKDYVSDLLAGNASGGMGVYLSSPVHNEKQGAVIGVAVIKLAAEKFYQILDHITELGGPHQTFLLDSDGIIVAHPDKNLLYRSLMPLAPKTVGAIRSANRFSVQSIASLNLPEVASVMVGATTPGYLRFNAPHTNKPSVLGYAPLEYHSWVVGVTESEEEFLKPIDRLIWKTAPTFFAVGIFALMLAIFFGRALTRPIRILTEVTGSVCGKGTSPLAACSLSEETLSELAMDAGPQQRLIHIIQTSDNEIGRLAQAFHEMLLALRAYIENLKEVTTAKERIETEMRFAASIQESFLPAPLQDVRNRVDLFATIHPAKQVGGDLYDFFFIDDDHLFIAIGDVSDKGMPAALFMGVSLALMRNIVGVTPSPSQILEELNKALCKKNDAYQFVTMFCGILNVNTGVLLYSHGGHNPPYYFQSREKSLHALVPVTGTALGVFEESVYEMSEIVMAQGDILLMYTDGVTEAMNHDRALYGEKRLEACFAQTSTIENAKEIAERILLDVKSYADSAPQSDDITLLCLKRPEPQ